MSEIKGILDQSTEQVIVLTDDKITLRGNVKIHGTLDVGLVRTTEIIADTRYDKKYLTFAYPGTEINGTGMIWSGSNANKEITLRPNPDRFFFSEHIELANSAFLLQNGSILVSKDTLGPSVTESSLKTLGTLRELTVNGNVTFQEHLYFNSRTGSLSLGNPEPNGLFTVYDNRFDVELIVEGSTTGNGRIGTFTGRPLELISGNQTRLTLGTNGIVEVAQTLVVNSKIGIGKNPEQDLDVAGNIRFNGITFYRGLEPPQSGFYNKGDICWNERPMYNSYIGWVCLISGTPGTWHPFGLIPS